jgi:integrase
MPRQQLPPQIKKITLKNGKVRYHVKENGRVEPITKQRPKLDKRFDTAQQARDALRDFQYQTARGTYVMRSTLTVEQACANWLAGRHGLRKSAKAAYRNGLQPLRDRCGEMPIQALEKRHLDELVTDLMAGGVVPVHVKEGRGVRGRYRRPWKATTINPMLNYLESMLNELLKQGKVNYNVAALVDRLPVSKVPMQTFTTVEVEKLLDTFAKDRLGHVWHLALVGLRRGELCGLRWTDIDFEAQTISIEITRVVVDGKVVEGDTKSETSTRVLPLTPELLAALRAATRMQAGEQLAAGPHLRAQRLRRRRPSGAALPPRHGVRLLGCGVCEGGREAHPAARRPAHLRHAYVPGAQRAGGDHLGVARARRYRVHYAHLRAQPTGEAGPRGREHLVVDEA